MSRDQYLTLGEIVGMRGISEAEAEANRVRAASRSRLTPAAAVTRWAESRSA